MWASIRDSSRWTDYSCAIYWRRQHQYVLIKINTCQCLNRNEKRVCCTHGTVYALSRLAQFHHHGGGYFVKQLFYNESKYYIIYTSKISIISPITPSLFTLLRRLFAWTLYLGSIKLVNVYNYVGTLVGNNSSRFFLYGPIIRNLWFQRVLPKTSLFIHGFHKIQRDMEIRVNCSASPAYFLPKFYSPCQLSVNHTVKLDIFHLHTKKCKVYSNKSSVRISKIKTLHPN